MWDTETAIFNACYRGRKFRKPKGTVVWVAEKITNIHAWNPEYSPLYYVRVRKFRDKRTEFVPYEYDFKKWIPLEVVSEQDMQDKRIRAIDSVMGKPWYRGEAEERRLYGDVIVDESRVPSTHPDER